MKPVAVRTVGFLVGDGALEDVTVFRVVRSGGFRVRDVEDVVAEFREEERVVGFFRAAGFFPPFDELGDGFRGGRASTRLTVAKRRWATPKGPSAG